jgi:hypothetical protein
MALRLSCPSCNTSFTLPELPPDRRAACPRCGDLFPVRTFTEVADAGVTPNNSPEPARVKSDQRVRAKRSIVRAIAVVLGMGVLGLVAGFVVYYLKSEPKPNPGPEVEQKPRPEAVPAGELAGLGYLPADTNIAFAVQAGPMVVYAERVKKNPRDLFVLVGLPPEVYDAFTNVGLSLPQIDHLAGGTSLGDSVFSVRLTLVLVLRKPLVNEEDFLSKLKARKVSGKQRYNFEIGGLPLLLERVSPTIWVLGWEEKDFQAVERGGFGPGGKQFSASLTRAITDQVPPNAAAWLTTSEDRWSEKPGVKLLVGELLKKKEWLNVLAKGRSLVTAVSLDEPPRLRLFIKTTDEASGQQLRAYFQKMAAADENVRQGGGGELAFFDTPFDLMKGFTTIRQWLENAGKP